MTMSVCDYLLQIFPKSMHSFELSGEPNKIGSETKQIEILGLKAAGQLRPIRPKP